MLRQVVLTGTETVEHLHSNLDAISETQLPSDLLERLEACFGHVSAVSDD